MSKTAHIVCVAAGTGPGRMAPRIGYHPMQDGLEEAVDGELWIGPRPRLETLAPAAAARDAGLLGTAARMIDEITGGDGGRSMLDALRPEADDAKYPAYIQIIPYYLFRHQGRYLRYLRTADGGEGRLHGKVSIGIGGHIDLADVAVAKDGSLDLAGTLMGAGRREAIEEIGIDIDPKAIRWVATIYATDTEVDRVHLGVVGVCDLTDAQVTQIDVSRELGEHSFMTLGEVAAEAEADDSKQLETWTRLVIQANPLA